MGVDELSQLPYLPCTEVTADIADCEEPPLARPRMRWVVKKFEDALYPCLSSRRLAGWLIEVTQSLCGKLVLAFRYGLRGNTDPEDQPVYGLARPETKNDLGSFDAPNASIGALGDDLEPGFCLRCPSIPRLLTAGLPPVCGGLALFRPRWRYSGPCGHGCCIEIWYPPTADAGDRTVVRSVCSPSGSIFPCSSYFG